MHLQKRNLANGQIRYYLRYWKDGKNKCVPTRVVRDDKLFKGIYPFKSRDEGLRFIKASEALKDYKAHSEGLKRIKKSYRFGNFQDWRTKFFKVLEEKAPNSHEGYKHYFDKFVTPFFLDEMKQFNINKWHLLFQDYRFYLKERAFKYNSTKLISYSTKNHCIGTLNSFLQFMSEAGEILKECNVKCRSFPRHLVDQNARTVKDIIGKEEFEQIKAQLGASQNFFHVLYHTGFRFNECFSLSIEDLYFEEHIAGGIEVNMRKKLEESGFKIYGYVRLLSQSKTKLRERDDLGHVKRKPLKGRKTQLRKDGRVIPIMDLESMNILTQRYNSAINRFNRQCHRSKDPADYFLFPEGYNELRRDFSNVSDKGFHACRHVRASFLIGRTRDQIVTRAILGHRSLDVFERYVHIYEAFIDKSEQTKKFTPRLIEEETAS